MCMLSFKSYGKGAANMWPYQLLIRRFSESMDKSYYTVGSRCMIILKEQQYDSVYFPRLYDKTHRIS